MKWPQTPYERLCCVTATAETLANAIDEDGSNTSNVLRLLVKELDSISAEVAEAEERQEKQSAKLGAPETSEEEDIFCCVKKTIEDARVDVTLAIEQLNVHGWAMQGLGACHDIEDEVLTTVGVPSDRALGRMVSAKEKLDGLGAELSRRAPAKEAAR